MSIRFSFTQWDNKLSHSSVLCYDETTSYKGKNLTTGSYSTYSINNIPRYHPLKDGLDSRIKKALYHICELNGAKILKEVF